LGLTKTLGGASKCVEMLANERGDNGKKPSQDTGSVYDFINEIQIGDVVFVYDGPRTILPYQRIYI